ncbi:hypothetical protein [Parasphingorhabdus halotolerans]|uniref:hypothetical protein n=1 Tax=Parasphingorhabdus halotolerans TaxID=2725558 RepID=UPI001B3A5661|nr:hypothetical protein [Parasphingorhabdus halotolerans]
MIGETGMRDCEEVILFRLLRSRFPTEIINGRGAGEFAFVFPFKLVMAFALTTIVTRPCCTDFTAKCDEISTKKRLDSVIAALTL